MRVSFAVPVTTPATKNATPANTIAIVRTIVILNLPELATLPYTTLTKFILAKLCIELELRVNRK
jgi:hypothetical protein